MWAQSAVHDEGGAGLVFTLAVLLLVAMAGQAALAVLAHEAKATATAADSLTAFQVAEAGLERAAFELARDPDWTDRRGATAVLDRAGGGWSPLCMDPRADGGCTRPADSVPFPSSAPLGTFRVRLRLWWGAGCGLEGCLCVWSTGTARAATRRVESVLTRPSPDDRVRVVSWREVLGEHDSDPCRRE